MATKIVRSLGVLLLGLSLTGCDPLGLEKAAEKLGYQIDQSVKDFLKGVDKAAKESDEWRQLVDKIRKDFKDFPDDLGLEARAFTDFMIARAKENVGEINKITKLLDEKKYGEAMTLFIALQKNIQGKYPPVVANMSPRNLDYVWADDATCKRKDNSLTTILIFGYNFDPASKKKLGVEIRDSKGKKLRTAWDQLAVSSPYLAQIDISAGSGLTFRPEETRLVLLHDDKDIATVVVTWGVRPPPAEVVTHIRIEYWVSHDDKDWDPVETITHSVTANGKVVLKSDQPSLFNLKPPFGANERWDHRGIQGPYPARRKQNGEPPDKKTEGEKKFDFGHKEDRTFALDQQIPIEIGKKMTGRLDIHKGGNKRWDDFSVHVYGITNKGHEIRYDNKWATTLNDKKHDNGWDFEWDKAQK